MHHGKPGRPPHRRSLSFLCADNICLPGLFSGSSVTEASFSQEEHQHVLLCGMVVAATGLNPNQLCRRQTGHTVRTMHTSISYFDES